MDKERKFFRIFEVSYATGCNWDRPKIETFERLSFILYRLIIATEFTNKIVHNKRCFKLSLYHANDTCLLFLLKDQ